MIASVRLTWDHGTVLLEPAGDVERRLRLDSLPDVLLDPRVGCYRAPACSLSAVRSALRERGIEPTGQLARPPWPLAGRWHGDFGLRDYQASAVNAWAAAGSRGVIALPTGAGKTRAACAAMAYVGQRTLVLVPTRVLLHQWVQEIGRWYGGRVTRWGDGDQQLGSITIATFASMQRHVARIGHRFSMVIIDEVHHFGTSARAEILDQCVAHARLGLTATMPEDGRRLAAIAHRVGPVVFERSLGELAGTALAPFRRVVLPCPLEPDIAKEYAADQEVFRRAWRSYPSQHPGRAWPDFVRACQRSDWGRRALRAWERCRERVAFPRAKRQQLARLLDLHRRCRTLVFAPNNRVVYQIARAHLVPAITCDIGRRERCEILEHFREGRLRVLVSGQVLNEGVDVPEADVAIIVGGRAGRREHLQRVGRVLRPSPGKLSTIYELVVPNTAEIPQSRRRAMPLESGSEGWR